MEILIPIIFGSIVGWVAGLSDTKKVFGMSGNIIIGAMGALVGSGLISILGFESRFYIDEFTAAIIGAVITTTYMYRLTFTYKN